MAQATFTHMPGHAGMAHGGQPMVHGHPSNQGIPGGGQPGVTMGQQLHPGMVIPGGPPVSQAGSMVAGMMPPGSGGPNAQAMAHLNPGPQTPFMTQQQQHMSKSCCSLEDNLRPFDARFLQSESMLNFPYQKVQFIKPRSCVLPSPHQRRSYYFPTENPCRSKHLILRT